MTHSFQCIFPKFPGLRIFWALQAYFIHALFIWHFPIHKSPAYWGLSAQWALPLSCQFSWGLNDFHHYNCGFSVIVIRMLMIGHLWLITRKSTICWCPKFSKLLLFWGPSENDDENLNCDLIGNCLSTVSASSPLHVVDNRSPQPGSTAHLWLVFSDILSVFMFVWYYQIGPESRLIHSWPIFTC